MLWVISGRVNARTFKPLPLCSAPQKTLLVEISGVLAKKKATFCEKQCFDKMLWVYRNWWMLEFSNICYCVQHPCKLTRISGALKKWKLLFKHKCVLRKCCGVSQKQCMLVLSNLCYCVQLCWKLTSRNFWNLSNERKPLYKQKCVLRKYWWMLDLANYSIVFSTP